MTDEYRFNNNYYGHIVNIDETEYYVQGRVDDPITMFRPNDDLLESERDPVQKLKGGMLE